jgi:uncharacterized BrkB/YihY/UPF0761 family membrane protein
MSMDPPPSRPTNHKNSALSYKFTLSSFPGLSVVIVIVTLLATDVTHRER